MILVQLKVPSLNWVKKCNLFFWTIFDNLFANFGLFKWERSPKKWRLTNFGSLFYECAIFLLLWNNKFTTFKTWHQSLALSQNQLIRYFWLRPIIIVYKISNSLQFHMNHACTKDQLILSCILITCFILKAANHHQFSS